MHVALNGWFWDQPTTGSGQYLHHLTDALARFHPDLRLTLILPPHIRQPQGIPERVNVVHAAARGGGKAGKIWFEQRGYPSAAKRAGADIAHVPYWGPPLSSSARLVVSVLDVIPLIFPEYRGGLFTQFYTSLAVAGAQGAGHILTISEQSKRDIQAHLNIPAEKITTTYLAASDQYAPVGDKKADEAVRQKYNLPDEYVLYLGGFDVRKNVNTLLLAWTYVGQAMSHFVPLVLAGKPPAEWGTPLYPDLPQYIRDLKIEDYVQWIGEVAEADKPTLYRMANLLVWPSLYEGFGLPPLEAMACGTPVVAADASSTPEVVGEAAYLVEAKNAREMGGAILAMLVQEDLQQQMANLVRGQATRFSWRTTAAETVKVYEQVMQA